MLVSQTPWVSAAQPWFNLALGVSPTEGAASSLQVNLTFYGRFDDASDLQQALSGTPSGTPLLRVDDVPVTDVAGVLTAAACVTVLPDSDASAPSSGPGICAAGVPGGTLTLGCTPSTDECEGVYAVSVALVRSGSSSPLSRFTTFLTYQQPNAMSATGRSAARRRRRPRRDGRRDHHGRRADGASRRGDHARREPARGERARGDALARRRARARPARCAQRRPDARPALRAHQRRRALRGGHRQRDRRADGPGRSGAAQRRAQARRRPLGGHRLDVLAGRRRQPGLGPAAGRGVPGRHQRRRPLLGRREQPDLRPTLHAGPRARLHRGGRGRRLRPEHTLHRRPGQSRPRGRAAARRALVRALREPLLQRAARGRRRRRRRGGGPRAPS